MNQTIARVDDDPTNLAESHISHGELLGVTEDNTHYKKRDINVNDIVTTNKDLADAREAEHGQVEERPITADTVELSVEKAYHPKIRDILRKHECLWAVSYTHLTLPTIYSV